MKLEMRCFFAVLQNQQNVGVAEINSLARLRFEKKNIRNISIQRSCNSDKQTKKDKFSLIVEIYLNYCLMEPIHINIYPP